MESLNDDQLQELLSKNDELEFEKFSPEERSKLNAYQELFKTLNEEPKVGLSLGFASKVRQRRQQSLNRRSDLQFNILVRALFLIGLLSAYGLLQLVDKSSAELVLDIVFKFKWILLAVLGMFFAMLKLDQVLAKRAF
ncbi:MAG: hypothetical protein EOO85_28480 [Pedobacter sp.]|nr:MAG: hypothetical protein EOO85_28480 [Pedobacter sp.]